MGEWSVQSLLAFGGSSSVFKVRNTQTGEYAAAKIPGRSEDDVDSEGHLQETLSHVNVVHVLHVSPRMLVMELVPTPLSHRIRGGPIHTDLTKKWLRQLMDGVRHAHQRGIVHCDLKPDNLLITEDEDLKIGDWGSACVAGTPKSQHTFPYAAIEVLLGVRTVGFALDVWAIGCVLAEMLTRKPLFPGDTCLQVLHSVTRKHPCPFWSDMRNIPHANLLRCFNPPAEQFVPGLDPQWESCLHKLLTSDPQLRPSLTMLRNDPLFQ